MLKQRAQAVRVREAIKARGLLLHDAFAKFDYSRTGMLSLDEVFGALDVTQRDSNPRSPGAFPCALLAHMDLEPGD